jgi:F0F1-type ATP synthase assembly protein I
MTEQRQSYGPGRVLAQVSLMVALPLLGGAIIGLVADNVLATTPLYTLIGLALGSLITAVLLLRYVVTNAARLRAGASRQDRDGNGRQAADKH